MLIDTGLLNNMSSKLKKKKKISIQKFVWRNLTGHAIPLNKMELIKWQTFEIV